GRVAGLGPVLGGLRRTVAVPVGDAQIQCGGVSGVQFGADAGQQVVVHRLLQQGVTERVAVVVGDEDAGGETLAQAGVQGRAVEVPCGGLLEQIAVDVHSAGGDQV